MNFKVGDEVVVITGSDKGKSGKIIKTLKAENRVVVEGVNVVKKHQKANMQGNGGIVEMEAPINASSTFTVVRRNPSPAQFPLSLINKETSVYLL